MKNKVIQFGEQVEGYSIPVLNEREIRAAAGVLFLFMFIALMLILFKGNFILIKYVVIIFFSDLLVRVLINPRFSPALIMGRLIVSSQVPEYVAAAPKKFAWKIGILLSGVMFFLVVIMNSYSIITTITCFMCLTFLFFEASFGICLGCLVYPLFYQVKPQYCAGEICAVTRKQDIQTISRMQLYVLLASFVFILLLIFLFQKSFAEEPKNLWAIINFRLSAS